MNTGGESVRICCIRFAEIEVRFIEAKFHPNKKAPCRQDYHVYQCGIDAASPQMDSMEYLPHIANQRLLHELLYFLWSFLIIIQFIELCSLLNQCKIRFSHSYRTPHPYLWNPSFSIIALMSKCSCPLIIPLSDSNFSLLQYV